MNTTTQADIYLSRQKKVIEKIRQNRLTGIAREPWGEHVLLYWADLPPE